MRLYHWEAGTTDSVSLIFFFFSSRRRHTRFDCDWSSDVCSSDLYFNRPGFEIFDYNIYAVCGDGCLMEGVASEAASLAGHLGLDNLCWVYDNNHITIEGSTRVAFTEDVETRFLAYGWNVLRVGDANDLE